MADKAERNNLSSHICDMLNFIVFNGENIPASSLDDFLLI